MATKGYEAFSVQDVLDDLGASKGAFYHYFGSKADLLDAVVERMTGDAIAIVQPLVEDPSTAALEKFHAVFGRIASWKGERRELVLALLERWVSPENTLVRERFRRDVMTRLVPILSAIVAQGRDEGAFAVEEPEATAAVLVTLLQGANEIAVDLYLARQAGTVSTDEVVRRLTAYNVAMERILAAPRGSIRILDDAVLREWFEPLPHPTEVAHA